MLRVTVVLLAIPDTRIQCRERPALGQLDSLHGEGSLAKCSRKGKGLGRRGSWTSSFEMGESTGMNV